MYHCNIKAASQGLAVILITHNVHHAYPVGNSFTVLNRGKSLGTFNKKDISREELLGTMASLTSLQIGLVSEKKYGVFSWRIKFRDLHTNMIFVLLG